MPSRSQFEHAGLLLVALLALAGIAWFFLPQRGKPRDATARAAAAGNAQPATTAPAAAPTPLVLRGPEDFARASRTFGDFQLRPLPVATQTDSNEWTKEDARDPAVIRRIAHNELEVQRLLAENARIQRRQLVYRKVPAWVLVERARGAGQPLANLVLPALDGRELSVEVTHTDLDVSGLNGTMAGRIAGRSNSSVTIAFRKGREAFTVLSPDDGLFLQGHPREPGEVIVTSFDPATYQPLPGGEPIKQPSAP
jgi:hypothetical protein